MFIEPGRSIVARAGVALYTVGGAKDVPGVRRFVSVDGGMADNIRPAIYGSPYSALLANRMDDARLETVTVAGKYCESGATSSSRTPSCLRSSPATSSRCPRRAPTLSRWRATTTLLARHRPRPRRRGAPHPPPRDLRGPDARGRLAAGVEIVDRSLEWLNDSRTNPETIHPPTGYTHIVEVQPGRVAYISGQVAFNQAGELVAEGSIVAQTRQGFENIKTALAAVGADFSHVIKLNYYAVDVSRLAEIRAVRNDYLAAPPPASTFVVVKGLVIPELLIEIEAVVALPS